MSRYRIVVDRYNGYSCQYWRWWFPVWIQIGWTNTHKTIKEAEEYIRGSIDLVVKYVDMENDFKENEDGKK